MEHTNEQIIEQLKLIGITNGRIFDQQCGACWEAINRSIEALKSGPKGNWLMENDGYADLFKCSECGEEWAMWFDDRKPQEQGYNFCPNCGADMRD